MALSALKVEKAKLGRYVDERGLMLVVKASGARSWVLRYQIDGRRRDMGLGSWPEISLSMARNRALAARQQIANGLDPLAQRRVRKVYQFRDLAAALIESKQSGWRNAKHAAQWASTLQRYVYPDLGAYDVQAITTELVFKMLIKIWNEKPETATRVRQRVEAVLDYSTAIGARTGENPARWRGHLDRLLPQPSKVRSVVHHPALDWQEMPAFMTRLRQQNATGASALAFAILTAARSGEVRGARWCEINYETKLWIVPAVRMKASKEHRVPLSEPAINLLGPQGCGSELIFPGSISAAKPTSDMTLSAVLKRMGMTAITVHGFRSSFRDWAGETTSYAREVIEAALAHRLKDKAEAAYARGDLLQKRRDLMEAWAAYICNGCPAP